MRNAMNYETLQNKLTEFQQNKEHIENEIKVKSQEIENLSNELSSDSNIKNQVKIIESYLNNKFKESLGNCTIDRSKEKQINEIIKNKNKQISNALSNFKNQKEESNRKYNEVYNNYTKHRFWVSEAEFKKAKNQNIKEIKEIEKKYINELKIVFLELDVDVARFYKYGISKYYLSLIIELMNKIKTQVEECGEFPLTYINKIYKWQVACDELVEDLETKYKQEESNEKAKIKKQASLLKEKEENIKKDISSYRSEIRKYNNKLETLKTKVLSDVDLEKNITKLLNKKDRKIEALKENVKNNELRIHNEKNVSIDNLEKDYNFKKNEILSLCEQKKKIIIEEKDNKVNIIKDEIAKIENKIDAFNSNLQGKNENVNELENEFNNTSSVLFIKRKSIKDQISKINTEIQDIKDQISNCYKDISNKNEEISLIDITSSLEKEDELSKNEYLELNSIKEQKINELENTCKSVIFDSLKQLEKEIKQLEKDTNSEISATKNEQKEVKEKIRDLTKGIEKAEEKIEELKTSLSEVRNNLAAKEEELERFHEKYIINKFAKKAGVIKDASDKKKRLDRSNKELDKLHNKLNTISLDIDKYKKQINILQETKNTEAKKEIERQAKRQEWIDSENTKRENEIFTLNNYLDSGTNIEEKFIPIINEVDLSLTNKGPLFDNEKHVITSNIAVINLKQMFDITTTNKYVTFFIDENRRFISDFRLIDKKEKDSITKISFELKFKDNSYSGKAFLLVLSDTSFDVLGILDYEIKIAFFEDFM